MVVVAIIAGLLALPLPLSLLPAREAARRNRCTDNLEPFEPASQNDANAQDNLPIGVRGTTRLGDHRGNPAGRPPSDRARRGVRPLAPTPSRRL